MKGIRPSFALIVAACVKSLPHHALAFAPSSFSQSTTRIELPINTVTPPRITSSDKRTIVKASSDGVDGPESDTPGLTINPPFALAYVAFLGYAYLRNGAESEGASMEVLQQYIADPTNPGFNELFITVFNLLGLYAAPIACLLMPGAKGQKLPATPFILGAMFGGYGVLGPYAITRTPNPSPVTKADLGWFTANVLENKLFNYFIVLVCASTFVTSGAIGAFVADPGQLLQGYADMFSETAIVSASSLDLAILTLSGASFIPEDLSRRGYKGDVAPELIAASSVLLPGLGVALYCALRPSLDEE